LIERFNLPAPNHTVDVDGGELDVLTARAARCHLLVAIDARGGGDGSSATVTGPSATACHSPRDLQ
jgi:hypothetical protein